MEDKQKEESSLPEQLHREASYTSWEELASIIGMTSVQPSIPLFTRPRDKQAV